MSFKLSRKSWLQAVLWAIALHFLLLNLTLPAFAVTVKSVPNPRQTYGGWVVDMANLLPPEAEASLNQQISALETANGSEIAIVTVPDTTPSLTPKQFATELFNYWRIGQKGLNNGVLVLISEADRRVEIETGYGIVPILPNAQVREIIQSQIIPHFKQGDFVGGVMVGTQAVITAISGNNVDSLPQFHAPSDSSQGLLLTVCLIAFGIASLLWEHLIKNWFSATTFIQPEGTSRSIFDDNAVKCAVCKQPMQKLDQELVLAHLNEPQRVAQTLGSIHVNGWRCSNCHPQLDSLKFHLRTHVLNANRFHLCPTCQELTLSRITDQESAATPAPGKHVVIEQCVCCGYYSEQEEIPLPLQDDSYSVTVNYGVNFNGSTSSGGGDFSGGTSGGDGAGGSW